jgi:twitching motility protein PilU
VNDLRLQIKLNSKHGDKDLVSGIQHLDIV